MSGFKFIDITNKCYQSNLDRIIQLEIAYQLKRIADNSGK